MSVLQSASILGFLNFDNKEAKETTENTKPHTDNVMRAEESEQTCLFVAIFIVIIKQDYPKQCSRGI